MKTGLSIFRTPALIGVMLSLPFAILELVFRVFVHPDPRVVHEPGFVIGLLVLFGFLWSLPFLSAAIGQRLMGEVAAEPRRLLQPAVIAKVAVVIGLAFLWGALVVDQLPCFLAVPNCD